MAVELEKEQQILVVNKDRPTGFVDIYSVNRFLSLSLTQSAITHTQFGNV